MNNKAKNILLILGFLFSLIISYKLAISNTVSLKKEYKSLKQHEELFKNSPKQLSILKQKQKYYDSLLVNYQLDGSSMQNSLLKSINLFADQNNLIVNSFLEPHIIVENDLSIKTYEFSIEGDYNSILKLIHLLEQQTKFGEIINLQFEKKKNYKTGKDYLQTRVLLKSFG